MGAVLTWVSREGCSEEGHFSLNLNKEKETALLRCRAAPRQVQRSRAGQERVLGPRTVRQSEHRRCAGHTQSICSPSPTPWSITWAVLFQFRGGGWALLERSFGGIGSGPMLQHLSGRRDLPTQACWLPSPLTGCHELLLMMVGHPAHSQVSPLYLQGCFTVPLGHSLEDFLFGQRLAGPF